MQQNKRVTANVRSHLLSHGMNDYPFKSQEDQQSQKEQYFFCFLKHTTET